MNMKTTLAVLGTAIVLAPGVVYAFAVGDQIGTAEADIRAKLQAAGYMVEEIEIDSDEIEVEATIDGQEVELTIDPATGLIAEVELDDEDDAEDEDEDGDDDDAMAKG